MMLLKLTVPFVQKSLNVLLRQHWAVFQKDQHMCDLCVKSAYNATGGRFHFRGKKVRITYTIYFATKQRHDYSNYAQKMIDDALVREGIIDDDNANVIVEEVLRIRYAKGNPHTDVLIEEIA